MAVDYDFIVGGGSIAGLAFAAEAAGRGASVKVLEEHEEIGEPEKCDGLVSLRGLKKFGYPPDPKAIQNDIASAVIHTPGGKRFAVNATALDVVVLDRSDFDKQVGDRAAKNGAEVRTGVRVGAVRETSDHVVISSKAGSDRARYYIDATGPSSSPKRGILPAAKYELEADWVREKVVEVFLDVEKYPGFFSWVIPYGGKKAKVGAAGFGISPFRALDTFLADRPHKVIRRISAPIYIGGPISRFQNGRTVFVGESAGQVKPTTAGGIMTSIAGAVSAAKWGVESLKRNNPSVMKNYQKEWEKTFLKEMRTMSRLRGVFQKMSNNDLEAVIDAVATPKLVLKLSQTDFDFHASSLLGAIGVGGLLRVARVVASAEVRSALLAS